MKRLLEVLSRQRWLAIAVVVVVVAALGWYFAAAPATAANQLIAAGTIEANTVRVSAQLGGRIESLAADEGDEVKAGQALAHLDEALLRAELKKAQAALTAAQAQLAQAQAGARPEDLRQAEAAVKLARAARDGAQVAWQDAQAARDNPQELDLKIAAARTQLAIAETRITQAAAGTRAAQAEYALWASVYDLISNPFTACADIPGYGKFCKDISFSTQRVSDTAYQWNNSTQRVTATWDAVNLATAARDAAKANLDGLLAQRANPLAANTQVDAAQTQSQSAGAALKQAEAALAMARAGATSDQIQMAQANVKQAEAAVQAIQVQLDKSTLRAPINGLVVARSVNAGEMAIPGVAVFTLADLDQVKLTLYIPETQIGRVKIGQPVTVRVDSFPNRTFQGSVNFISPQAEFTPRSAQTQEERSKTMFAVKVMIANPDHALKPGMPADAVIEETK